MSDSVYLRTPKPPRVASPPPEETLEPRKPNYRCMRPEDYMQEPSGCPDFHLDPSDPETKYVCPTCGRQRLMPLF